MQRDVGGSPGQGEAHKSVETEGGAGPGCLSCALWAAGWVGLCWGHGARLCGSPLCGKGRAWQEERRGKSTEKVETGSNPVQGPQAPSWRGLRSHFLFKP